MKTCVVNRSVVVHVVFSQLFSNTLFNHIHDLLLVCSGILLIFQKPFSVPNNIFQQKKSVVRQVCLVFEPWISSSPKIIVESHTRIYQLELLLFSKRKIRSTDGTISATAVSTLRLAVHSQTLNFVKIIQSDLTISKIDFLDARTIHSSLNSTSNTSSKRIFHLHHVSFILQYLQNIFQNRCYA